jgi:hypothetical protein
MGSRTPVCLTACSTIGTNSNDGSVSRSCKASKRSLPRLLLIVDNNSEGVDAGKYPCDVKVGVVDNNLPLLSLGLERNRLSPEFFNTTCFCLLCFSTSAVC